MNESKYETIFKEIVEALVEKGYSPYEQILGYLKSDSDIYITRYCDARRKIKLVSKEWLKQQILNLQ